MFELETFDNGTRLLTADKPDSPSATALVMFGVGSRFEQARQSGIAHFAEHMFFKGTERRPTARDISVEIDGIGGEFNAFTGKEYTGYYVKSSAEHLPLAVDVLADMLLHSKFDPEEIEREKGVILEEMNMYRDTPTRYIHNVYDQHMYGDTPLGWDIIGNEEVIKGADRDLFMSFLDPWYTGRRCVVGTGGCISDEARTKVQSTFGTLPMGDEMSCEPGKWEQTGPRVRVHYKESDQAHLCIGLRSPGLIHPDRYAFNVFNAVLGSGMSSRLFTEVRERLGLCYYVRSWPDQYVDVGSLAVGAGVDTGRIELAIETIVNELWKMLSEAPDEAEFKKAKSYLKGRFVLGIEDSSSMITFGVRREAVEGAYVQPEEVLAAYDAVTMEDVMRVANDLLNPDMLNLAVLGPFKDEAPFLAALQPSAIAV